MKAIRNIAAILLAAGLLISLASPALAQESGFDESFEESSPPGWELHPEQAQVSEGTLRLTPGGFALHFGDWKISTLTVRVKFSATAEAVIGYTFGERGRYLLVVGSSRLALEKDGEPGGLLGEMDGADLAADTWHTVEVQISASEHTILVDETIQLTASDPEPLEAGAVMLTARGDGEVEFDDLQVRGTPVGGMPPGEEDGAPSEGDAPPLEESEAAPAVGDNEASETTTANDGTGSRESLITEFFASQASTIELTTFLINLILAAVCATVLGIVYTHWGSSLTNRRKFAANFLLMTITTTFIIMVVRSSIALSLGLVGALSIVRFRAAVKEPEELAYLFFALGIGIGLGDNQRLITLIAMAAGIALLGLRHLLRKPAADINMHVQIASRNTAEVSLGQISETLGRHCAKVKLIRFDESDSALEAGYLVELRHTDDLIALREALKAMAPGLEITFMDNKGIW